MHMGELECPWSTPSLLTWLGIAAIVTGATWKSNQPIHPEDEQKIKDWVMEQNIPFRATGRVCAWRSINEHRGVLMVDDIPAHQGKLDDSTLSKFIQVMYGPLFLDYPFGFFEYDENGQRKMMAQS